MERENIITTGAEIADLLSGVKRIAVLGIKTENQADQPAFYVPKFLKDKGYEIIPVPVYYPEVTEIMGLRVYRKLEEIPGEIDLLNVFRRPLDIDKHIDEILAKKPKAVWFQSGIRNDIAAGMFAKAGMKVVQDRCLMVEARRL